jgi:hypothetical protein
MDMSNASQAQRALMMRQVLQQKYRTAQSSAQQVRQSMGQRAHFISQSHGGIQVSQEVLAQDSQWVALNREMQRLIGVCQQLSQSMRGPTQNAHAQAQAQAHARAQAQQGQPGQQQQQMSLQMQQAQAAQLQQRQMLQMQQMQAAAAGNMGGMGGNVGMQMPGQTLGLGMGMMTAQQQQQNGQNGVQQRQQNGMGQMGGGMG